MDYEVFISHASEDKVDVALPLARRLEQHGIKVWLDAFELTLGDSLRSSIDRGLSKSRFGIVVLSPDFFRKEWPSRELDALFTREDSGDKVILPVWHRVSQADVLRFSPMLAAKMAVSTARGLDSVASEIIRAVKAASVGGSVPPERFDYAAQELMSIRKQMLVATSRWEVREDLYAVEDFLQRYPHHPEGRLLRDQLLQAADFAKKAERPALAMRSPAHWLIAVVLLLLVLLLAIVIFFARR